jgi:hypothetical protein
MENTMNQKKIIRKSTLDRSRLFILLFFFLVWSNLVNGQLKKVDSTVIVKVYSSTIGKSSFSVGVTHVGPRWEDGDPQAVKRAMELLTGVIKFQNQHIMNWGVGNPEPSPGVYNWTSLDKRVELIRSMNAIPILTFCSAPGWMNTTGDDSPKQTSPNHWADARVTDDHVNDYAELCKQVAMRYRDVKYFQVWNEFKGYWSKELKNWDYVRYTDFYNAVYDAVKSVRPDALLGGPYFFELDDAKSEEIVDYWFKNKHGADFVCFDSWIAGYPPTGDVSEEAKKMRLTNHFGRIAKQYRSRTDLPIWVSEFYGGWSSNPQFTAANHASCYLHCVLSGVSVVLLWGPESQRWNYLFTSTKTAEGGQPSPHYNAVKIFNTYFGPGTQLYKTESSSPDIEVLASTAKTLLINKRNESVDVLLNGKKIMMTPYEVRLEDGSQN